MQRLATRSLLAVVAVLVLVWATPLLAQPAAAPEEHPAEHAQAATGEAHAEDEHAGAHSNTFLGLPRPVFLTFNLLVFLGGLAWFAGPVLARFLGEKQQEIRHALAEADRQREEAASMEARVTAQLAELRREMEELAARAEREGERERQEILDEAERERVRLQAATRNEIESSLHQARQQLTAHAARLAAQLAEERIAAGLTRDDRKRLFRDNLARLERLGGAAASGGASAGSDS